ncbi:methyltransferase [Candidatus Woesearchaeota archaeon]|nr:methyltransferase [Candidatus Woesearchaeota archaeon]
MKAFAVCSKGIEDIAAKEIEELIGAASAAKTEISDSCIIFEITTLLDLCLLAYKAQSLDRVLLLLAESSFSSREDLLKKLEAQLKEFKIDAWLEKDSTFKVFCQKTANSAFSSEEIAADVGGIIIEKTKAEHGYKQKVDLDNPGITFFLFINGSQAFVGIDFAGKDLHKREYKIFPHAASLRGTLAYAMLRIADWKPGEILLDPFSHSGEIPIEAALCQAQTPIRFYEKEKFPFLRFRPLQKENFQKFFDKIDKKIKEPKKNTIFCLDPWMPSLAASKKNAKIAGVNKCINFSRTDTEWLDVKHKKESFDRIVTHPPEESARIKKDLLEKLSRELFYQAEFILKKDGTITIISRNIEPFKRYAEQYKFKLAHERKVFAGKEEMQVIVFNRP